MYSESSKLILVDLIADVVDSMRATDSIVSFTYSNGTYSLVTPNSLSNSEVVKIDGSDYVVSNVSDEGFDISDVEGLDFAGKTWKALAPYYEHGHILEISNTLNAKNEGVYAYQKYPLIILFQDYKGSKTTSDDAIFGNVLANMAICNNTLPELKSSERYDYNFRNTLFPIYDQLLIAINEIAYFKTSPSNTPVDHDWYERPYWGSHLAQTKNMLNDYLDAIELQNVNLDILNGITQC